MRVETLPSPGLLSNGIRIRIEAAKAISAVEINAGIAANGGKSSTAKPLSDFFTACAAALAGFVDATAPTNTARTISPSFTSRLTLAFSEGLDPKFVPAGAAFAVAGQVKTVTKVTVDGPLVHLDVNTPFIIGAVTVAYTQPGATTNLRDLSGNLVANITATGVTNGIV
jgi:hypothetical protein